MLVEKVKFGGREYLVMDRFEYQDKEYIYIFEDISKDIKGKDLKNLTENIEAKADFIYKCEDGKYENVVDDDLYEKLMILVNKRNMTGQSNLFDINQFSGNKGGKK